MFTVGSKYLAAVYRLPNRAYFPSLSAMSGEQLHATLGNLYVYAVLELLSLVVLHAVLKHKFHLPGISQLAFIPEKQWSKVQSRLIFWVLYNAQPPLLHFGTTPLYPALSSIGVTELVWWVRCVHEGFDYTFKFAWLHHDQAAANVTDGSS